MWRTLPDLRAEKKRRILSRLCLSWASGPGKNCFPIICVVITFGPHSNYKRSVESLKDKLDGHMTRVPLGKRRRVGRRP